jgi:Flp pilus assembly protein TadG
MYDLWNRFRGDRRGVAAVEFALLLPMLLVLLVGIAEVGRYLGQAEAVEKGLRAGAMFAARQALTSGNLSGAAETTITNLVQRGTLDTSGSYLAGGWGESGATLTITTTSTPSGAGMDVTVIELTATLPYDEMLPGMLAFVGISSLSLTMSHEQVHVGA